MDTPVPKRFLPLAIEYITVPYSIAELIRHTQMLLVHKYTTVIVCMTWLSQHYISNQSFVLAVSRHDEHKHFIRSCRCVGGAIHPVTCPIGYIHVIPYKLLPHTRVKLITHCFVRTADIKGCGLENGGRGRT